MATGFGKRQIRSMINWAAGKTPADTAAGVWHVGLHVGDPGDDGQSGAEATGTGYARVATTAATWDAATDATPSVLDNGLPITFPAAVTDWSGASSFTHFSLWTTPAGTTEADYVGRGGLTTPAPVLAGQTPTFPAGALRMTGSETP